MFWAWFSIDSAVDTAKQYSFYRYCKTAASIQVQLCPLWTNMPANVHHELPTAAEYIHDVATNYIARTAMLQ